VYAGEVPALHCPAPDAITVPSLALNVGAARETAVPTVTVVEVENEASPPSEAAVTVMVPAAVPSTLTKPILLTKSDLVIRAVVVAVGALEVKFPEANVALETLPAETVTLIASSPDRTPFTFTLISEP